YAPRSDKNQKDPGGVVLWDVKTRARTWQARLEVSAGGVEKVIFSGNGKIMAAWCVPEDGYRTVVLWDVPRRTRLGQSDDELQVGDFVVDFDGTVLAASVYGKRGNGGTLLWQIGGGKVDRLQKGPVWSSIGLHSLAFSPVGKTLAAGDAGKVKLWN